MSQRFVGLSDGRLPRALRAMGDLAAIGFTDTGEIQALHKIYRHRLRRERKARKRGGRDDASRLARRESALGSIRQLMKLGFNESEIAALADVDHTTIAHLLNPEDSRGVSPETARRLREAVLGAGVERLKLLVPLVPITVLDTCNDKGREVDDRTLNALAGSVRSVIRNALLLSSVPVPLATGIHGVLASVGDPAHGMYVFMAPFEGEMTPESRYSHLRRAEHEAEHLYLRFRAERQELEKIVNPRRDDSNDGRIA